MKKQQDHELTSEVVDEAFRQTAASVVRKAKATGTSIIVAVKGKVKKLPYQQFEHLLEPKRISTSKKQKK
jgi:hypothetical protein